MLLNNNIIKKKSSNVSFHLDSIKLIWADLKHPIATSEKRLSVRQLMGKFVASGFLIVTNRCKHDRNIQGPFNGGANSLSTQFSVSYCLSNLIKLSYLHPI